MADVDQYVDLVGSSAAGVPIDSTGTAYDGEYRLLWQYGTPAPYEDAKLVFGGDFSQSDATVDVVLRNYSDGSNIASLTGISDEPNRDEVRFDPTDIDPGDVIGVRVNVDSASGTGGATVDVGARLVLIP